MVDVDAFLEGLYADEGWQEALGDDVATVIRALEGRYPAGGQLSAAEADRIRAIVHSGASAAQMVHQL